jgi:hypothetical protein
MHSPDKWVIVNIMKGLYKVLGGWNGGYLGADSWRMSSGLKNIESDPDDENYYLMHSHSGSIYRCHKKANGLTMLSGSILSKMQNISDEVITVSVEEYLKEIKREREGDK